MNQLIFFIVVAGLAAGGAAAYFLLKPKRQQRTESLYTDALDSIIKGETSTALQLLRDVVRQNSEHVDAYLKMGEILRESNPQHAIKIHQSLTVRPGLSSQLRLDIYKALALDYKQLDQLNRARREAEQMLKIERRDIWATEFLLKIAEQKRDWPRAAELARSMQKSTGEQDSVQLARFRVFEGLDKQDNGDQEGAKAAFYKASKQAPDYGLPHYHLGNLFAQNRDLVKAIESWETYAMLEPSESCRVFTRIETALFDLGRFSEVEKFYRRVLEKDPGNMDAISKLANVLEEKGERQAALNLVEEALSTAESSLHARLMKLKLSLHTSTPHELAHQIDDLIDLVTESPASE